MITSKNRKRGRQTGVRQSSPYRRYEPDTEIQYRPPYASKTNGTQLTHHGRESKRKADTEIQYRPRIVDTDIDCGPRFCGPRFRDSYYKVGGLLQSDLKSDPKLDLTPKVIIFSLFSGQEVIRAACLQNETAPKNF